MVRLRVLGGAILRADGDLVTGRAAQPYHLAVLAVLSAAPGQAASRDRLVGLLWPDSGSSRARHRLSVALHVLRKDLGDQAILSSGDALTLNPEAVWTDVQSFTDAVSGGRLEEAVALYRGPFLDAFFLSGAAAFERWMDSERERLAGLYRAALERLITEAEGAGDLPEASTWWRRLAAHDPYSGPVAMGLMRALAAEGDLAGAISHARAHATLLQAELDLPADPGVLELAEELARMAKRRIEASSSDSGPGSVPESHTDEGGRFIGDEGARSQSAARAKSPIQPPSVATDSLPSRARTEEEEDQRSGSPSPAVVGGVLGFTTLMALGGIWMSDRSGKPPPPDVITLGGRVALRRLRTRRGVRDPRRRPGPGRPDHPRIRSGPECEPERFPVSSGIEPGVQPPFPTRRAPRGRG